MLKQGLNNTFSNRFSNWFLKLPLAIVKPLIAGYVSPQTLMLKSAVIKKELLQQAKERGLVDEMPGLNKTHITAIPTCLVQISPSHLANNDKVSPLLFLDMINTSAMVNYKGQPVFWDSIQHGWDLVSLLIKAAAVQSGSIANQTISLIQCATKLSSDVFFIEFSSSLGYQRSLIGYYDQQQLKFIGLTMGKVQLFGNIDQYIGKVFGSKLKLKEFLEENTGQLKDPEIMRIKAKRSRFTDDLALKVTKPSKLAVNV